MLNFTDKGSKAKHNISLPLAALMMTFLHASTSCCKNVFIKSASGTYESTIRRPNRESAMISGINRAFAAHYTGEWQGDHLEICVQISVLIYQGKI